MNKKIRSFVPVFIDPEILNLMNLQLRLVELKKLKRFVRAWKRCLRRHIKIKWSVQTIPDMIIKIK